MQRSILICCCLSHKAAICFAVRNLRHQNTRLQSKEPKSQRKIHKSSANENPNQTVARRASLLRIRKDLGIQTPGQVKGAIKSPPQELAQLPSDS